MTTGKTETIRKPDSVQVGKGILMEFVRAKYG